MVRWTPEILAEHAGGELVRRGTRPIATACIDSRLVRPGALFVAIVAARDGHDFVDDAITAGATGVLQERGRAQPDGDVTIVEVDDTLAAMQRLAARSRDLVHGPVVAISGSNGKTTTRAMIAAVLGGAMPDVLCTRGNLNNHLGVPLTLLDELDERTIVPRAMVVELGMSAPGENDRLAAIVRPTIAVVTSIALEHLESMGSIEAIAAAEAEPFAYVAPGGAVVVPADEPLLAPHLPRAGAAVIRFGPDEDAEVRIVDVAVGERTRARLRVGRGGPVVEVALRPFGSHNARNAAAALAVGLHLGLPVQQMIESLEAVEPVGDRGRTLVLGPHLVVADCYNANPGSVAAALASLVELRTARSGPLVAVLGDMLELGPTEDELHAEVGRLCAQLGLDAVATMGPRSAAIARAAAAGGVAVERCDDAPAAAAWVRARLADGAPGAVLVKGSRGMKLERVIAALCGEP
jgi:UDP-N-acetylmuramoyl-tripeptide--D-alanyl-D-alanine ligase